MEQCQKKPRAINLIVIYPIGQNASCSRGIYFQFVDILVPRGRASFGQHQESRPLGGTILKYKGINRIPPIRLRSLHLFRMPEMVVPRVSCLSTAGQGE